MAQREIVQHSTARQSRSIVMLLLFCAVLYLFPTNSPASDNPVILVSQGSPEYHKEFRKHFKKSFRVTHPNVKVIDIDALGRVRLSRKAVLREKSRRESPEPAAAGARPGRGPDRGPHPGRREGGRGPRRGGRDRCGSSSLDL